MTPSTVPTPAGIQRFAGLWVFDADTLRIAAGDARTGTEAWASLRLQGPSEVRLLFRTILPVADTVLLMGAVNSPQAMWRFVRSGDALYRYPGPPSAIVPFRRAQ